MAHHVIVFSHRRSGTHLTIDAIRNNFAPYSAPFINVDDLQSNAHVEQKLAAFGSQLKSAPRVLKSHASASLQAHFINDEVYHTIRDAVGKAKIIYVYRDGRDVMVSYYHYVRSVKPELNKTTFQEFLRMRDPIGVRKAHDNLNNVEYWTFHVTGWLKRNDILPISFESLLEKYDEQIERLSGFLELSMPGEIQDVVRTETNSRSPSNRWVRGREKAYKLWNRLFLDRELTSVNFRQGLAGTYADVFSNSDLEYFNSIASNLLLELGYLPRPSQMTVIVLGRFPPPIDGQTLATERLATLLETDLRVTRINMEIPRTKSSSSIIRSFHRAIHFMRLRAQLRARFKREPSGSVLWPAVSPDFFGHLRDLLTTVPALRQDQKVYAVVHRGNFRQVFESPFTSATAKRLVRRLQSVIFLTDDLSAQCANWIPESKRVVIPNTLDDDLIFSDSEVEDKQALRVTRERLCLLFVGHMLPSKGYLDVLEALHIIHQNGVQFDGHFVGGWNTDDDRENFNAQVRYHGLEGVVHHHGSLSDRGAIKSLYRDADVLLLPTYYRNEAQPLVILEALSSATPVISTRHAGIPEMIRHEKEGLLVSARDPDALARAVDRLSSIDYWKEISIQARQRFLSEYAPDQVRRMWMKLISD